MENKRLDYLDMVKGIGSLLVLMGHLQDKTILSYSPYIKPFCVYIFSFHMPMFFILSGILLAIKNDDRKDIKEIAKRRFRGLMIPYFWFSVYIILNILYYMFVTKTVPLSTLTLNLWYFVSCYGMNVLWFLPALFLGEILFIHIRQKLKDEKKIITSIVIICAVIFVISSLLVKVNQEVIIYKRLREAATIVIRPFLVCGFIAVGYYARKACENVEFLRKYFIEPKKNENGKVTKGIKISYILMGTFLMLVCLAFMGVNNGIDFRTMAFRNVFFFLLCALSGSFGLIIICKGLPRSRFLCYLGRGSLIFMATHSWDFLLPHAIWMAMLVNQYVTRARGYVSYLVIVVTITLFCSLMIYIIQNYLPFILGKPYKKKKSI